MTSTFRAAVIGCGKMARGHARAYNADPRVDLVACADIFAEAAKRFADEFGIAQRYTDYHQMLERERLDIVSICTHHPLHAPMTIDTARLAHPRAILCEKPIALDLASADEMIATCRETNTLLLVGHQRRYGRQYVAAREALATGRIGEVLFVEAFGHPRSSLLVDSTHTVDLVRFFLDDPRGEWVIGQIDARSHHSAWGQQIEDCALGWIGLQGDVRLLLGAGSATREGSEERTKISPRPITGRTYHRIVLHGSTGRLEIDGDAPNDGGSLVRIHVGNEVEVVFSTEDFDREPAFSAVDLEVSAMVDCLEQPGLTHPLEAQSARDTLEILLALYESSRRRQLVTLPMAVEDNPLIAMLDAGVI
ncbi:MAG: Gfo/Idh/MocA family protein [Thermomicrobiales bacterium]